MTCVKDFIYRLTIYKYQIIFLSLVVIFCFFCPVHNGGQEHTKMYVFEKYEQMTQGYCDTVLKKATAAYVSTKSASKIIAVMSDAHIQINAPLVGGITFAPGKILTTASDVLDKISTGLFLVVSVVLIEKILIGIIPILCLKVCVPISAIFFITAYFLNSIFLKKIAVFVVRITIIVLFFIPSLAIINKYIDTMYLDNIYVSNMETVNNSILELDKNQYQYEIDDFDSDKNGFFSSFEEFADKMKQKAANIPISVYGFVKDKINLIFTSVESIADNLTLILMILVVTTFIVPIGMLFVLVSVINMLIEDLR